MQTVDTPYGEWEASLLARVCDAARSGDAFYVGFALNVAANRLKAGELLPRILSIYISEVLTRVADDLGSARKALGFKLDRRIRPGKTERDLDIVYRVFTAYASASSKSLEDIFDEIAEQVHVSRDTVAKVWKDSREARRRADALSAKSLGWPTVDLSLEPPLTRPARPRKVKVQK